MLGFWSVATRDWSILALKSVMFQSRAGFLVRRDGRWSLNLFDGPDV